MPFNAAVIVLVTKKLDAGNMLILTMFVIVIQLIFVMYKLFLYFMIFAALRSGEYTIDSSNLHPMEPVPDSGKRVSIV